MSKTVIRITPYGGFDIAGLESWLAALAAKGLHFSATAGPLTVFERGEPKTLQIHLEPIRGAVREDPELNAIYEEGGWHYLGIFRGAFFAFSTDDPQAQAHTDPETLGYSLGRFFRQKLMGGLLLAGLGVLLLGMYANGVRDLSWWLQYFPVERLSDGKTLPFLLAALGLFLLVLSYLLGLVQLTRYRRSVRAGKAFRSRRGGGWMALAGLLILAPVVINSVQLYLGMDYGVCSLEDSGAVTLTDLEGEDFRLSGDYMYNMDRISHGGTLLQPEHWGFRQYGAFSQYGDIGPNDVSHLETYAVRYPLEGLAELRAEELSAGRTNGLEAYRDLEPVSGLDQALYARREGWTAENGREFLPGGMLILRRGGTVLHVDYYGEQDLRAHLPQFAAFMEQL